MVQYLISKCKGIKISSLGSNLASNWFIPFSAVSYLLLNTGLPSQKWSEADSFFAIIPAFFLLLLLSVVCDPFIEFFKTCSIRIKVISLLSAIGINYSTWLIMRYYPYVFGGNCFIFRTVFMILGIPFVTAACMLFWSRLEVLVRSVFSSIDFKKWELIVYAVVFLIICVLITVSFLSSRAFTGMNNQPDIIYTSDSTSLVKFNAYILLDHPENDIRQPLFGVFSAPLMGIPCLIGNLIPGIPMAVVLGYAQLFLLIFTTFVLSTQLKLNPVQRTCFFVLVSASYQFLLFSIMLEQYITAYFWLVMTICFFNKEKTVNTLSVAAGGTLLTSGVLVPFVFLPKKFNFDGFISLLKKLLGFGVDFVLVMVMMGRTHIILKSIDNLVLCSVYTGESVGLFKRILQYFNFIGSCFIAPAAEVQTYEDNLSSWQMSEVVSVNLLGVIVLLISLVSFFITRKDKISKFALGWMLYSFVILVLVGWGTSENGLILYALYFGWAFFVLVFNLLKSIENKMKAKWLVPICTVILSGLMLFYNIPAISELVKFAIAAYHV